MVPQGLAESRYHTDMCDSCVHNLSTKVKGVTHNGPGSRVLRRLTLPRNGNMDNLCSIGDGLVLAPVDAGTVTPSLTQGDKEWPETRGAFTSMECADSCESDEIFLPSTQVGRDAASTSLSAASADSDVDAACLNDLRLDAEAVALPERQSVQDVNQILCDLDGVEHEAGAKGKLEAQIGTAPTTPATDSSHDSFARTCSGISKTSSRTFSIGSVEEEYLSTLNGARDENRSTYRDGRAARSGGVMSRIRAWEVKCDPTLEEEGVEFSTTHDRACSEAGPFEGDCDESCGSAEEGAEPVAEEMVEATPSQRCGHGDGGSSMHASSFSEEEVTLARSGRGVQQNASVREDGQSDGWNDYKRGIFHGGLAAVGVGLVGVAALVFARRR